MKKTLILLVALLVGMMAFATDWSSIPYLADGAGDGAYANKYKVAAAFGQTVANIQQPDFAAAPGIYTSFSAGISSCTLKEGDCLINGAGIILYLSAFTAKVTAVSVEAGGVSYDFQVYFEDGTGDIPDDPQTGGDPQPGGSLTPATYRSSEVITCAGADVTFNWAITRNADATLTFELKWSSDIVGSVPQVCINGAYTTMPSQERVARFTTKATFVDGTTLNDTFFYLAYAGGAARIEITGYKVGASNVELQPAAIENIFNNETHTRKVIENGMLYIIKDGIRYNALGAEMR